MRYSYRPIPGGYATAIPNIGTVVVQRDMTNGWKAHHRLCGLQSASHKSLDAAVDEVIAKVQKRIDDVASAKAIQTVEQAQSEYMAARRIAPTLTYAETRLLWEAMQQYVDNSDGTPPPGAEALRNRLDTLMLGFMSVPPLPGVIA